MFGNAVIEFLMNPVNFPKGNHYNGIGHHRSELPCRTNPDKKTINEARFLIYVENGVIKQARHEVFGDPVVHAACSWCVKCLVGKNVSEARGLIDTEKLVDVLKVSWESDYTKSCLTVVLAVYGALTDYYDKKIST